VHLIASRVHLIASRVHLIASRVHLIASRVHLIASRVHLIASRVHLIASRVHLIASRVHLIASREHLIASREHLSSGGSVPGEGTRHACAHHSASPLLRRECTGRGHGFAARRPGVSSNGMSLPALPSDCHLMNHLIADFLR